jgi:Tfp pilus assembly protein PilV
MHKNLPDEGGMTLVETMIATLILGVGLLAITQALTFSVVASKVYGHHAMQATAAARDKMQELTGLKFADTTANVTVAAPFPTNGVGLTAGGSILPSSSVAGYIDYIDAAGVRTTQSAAAYTRRWQILNDDTSLKRIIVVVTSNKNYRNGSAPSTTLVTYKTP